MWYICQLVSSLLILPKDVIELTFEFLTRMILEKCIFFYWLISEPPSSVVILDGFLQQLSVVAGPLEEGNDLILTCKAYGGMKHKRNSLMALVFFLFIYLFHFWFDLTGYPQPWVTWWQGGQLLDNTTDARSPESVSNLLVVPRVGR
jgi:hypothetical protein